MHKKEEFDFSNTENDEDIEITTKEILITAWYTPQIPISNGPAKYQGLPGLILEINDGSKTLICSSIILNPTQRVEIKAPTKGKKVNQQEYDEIMDKKIQEMQESYHSSDRNSGDQHNEIRIGG